MDIRRVVVGPLETNCYLIIADNELAVVDPGDEMKKIETEIEKIGDIKYKYILLTHGHFDHVSAVNALKDEYGFKVAVGEKDKDIMDLNSQIGVQVSKTKADVLVPAEGGTLCIGNEIIKVIETPGHTSGSVSYLIEENLFSGDTLFYNTHGRTDLPSGNNNDMKRSLEKLVKLDEKIKVFPGHGKRTTIEEERKSFKNHSF